MKDTAKSIHAGHDGEGRTRTTGFRRMKVKDGRWVYWNDADHREIPLDPMFDESLWNLGKLSQKLGLSPRTMSRLIEESVGISGKTWLRRIRAVKACHLLREGVKVAHVGRLLGFRHQPDFTREFNAQVGVTPSAFIQSERKRMFLP